MNIIQQIEKLIKPPIEALGLKLYEVTLTLNQGEKYLNVLIEKPLQRIGLEEIIKVTQTINPLLDEANLIQEHYILDVASAGAEHPIHLDELPQYVNRNIYLHLLHPFEGENQIQGRLDKLTNSHAWIEIQVKTRKRLIEINRKDIDYARLAVAMK
jgi:ribosome maturation factor RimP